MGDQDQRPQRYHQQVNNGYEAHQGNPTCAAMWHSDSDRRPEPSGALDLVCSTEVVKAQRRRFCRGQYDHLVWSSLVALETGGTPLAG